MKTKNIIVEKSFEFALSIIQPYKDLVNNKEFIISKQLLKSWTSIWANVNEVTAAQSKKNFIAKMSIASKEARETLYWLNLLEKSSLIKLDSKYLIDIEEIIKIITSITKTASKNIIKH